MNTATPQAQATPGTRRKRPRARKPRFIGPINIDEYAKRRMQSERDKARNEARAALASSRGAPKPKPPAKGKGKGRQAAKPTPQVLKERRPNPTRTVQSGQSSWEHKLHSAITRGQRYRLSGIPRRQELGTERDVFQPTNTAASSSLNFIDETPYQVAVGEATLPLTIALPATAGEAVHYIVYATPDHITPFAFRKLTAPNWPSAPANAAAVDTLLTSKELVIAKWGASSDPYSWNTAALADTGIYTGPVVAVGGMQLSVELITKDPELTVTYETTWGTAFGAPDRPGTPQLMAFTAAGVTTPLKFGDALTSANNGYVEYHGGPWMNLGADYSTLKTKYPTPTSAATINSYPEPARSRGCWIIVSVSGPANKLCTFEVVHHRWVGFVLNDTSTSTIVGTIKASPYDYPVWFYKTQIAGIAATLNHKALVGAVRGMKSAVGANETGFRSKLKGLEDKIKHIAGLDQSTGDESHTRIKDNAKTAAEIAATVGGAHYASRGFKLAEDFLTSEARTFAGFAGEAIEGTAPLLLLAA